MYDWIFALNFCSYKTRIQTAAKIEAIYTRVRISINMESSSSNYNTC